MPSPQQWVASPSNHEPRLILFVLHCFCWVVCHSSEERREYRKSIKFRPGHHKLMSSQLALGCGRGLELCCLFSYTTTPPPLPSPVPSVTSQNLYLALRSPRWAKAHLLHQVNWTPFSIIFTLRPLHPHELPLLIELSTLPILEHSSPRLFLRQPGALFLLWSLPYLPLKDHRQVFPISPRIFFFNILNYTNNSVDYLSSCTHPVCSPALGVLQGSVLAHLLISLSNDSLG